MVHDVSSVCLLLEAEAMNACLGTDTARVHYAQYTHWKDTPSHSLYYTETQYKGIHISSNIMDYATYCNSTILLHIVVVA